MSRWTDEELEFLDELDAMLDHYELSEDALKAAEGKMFNHRESFYSIWKDEDAGEIGEEEMSILLNDLYEFPGATIKMMKDAVEDIEVSSSTEHDWDFDEAVEEFDDEEIKELGPDSYPDLEEEGQD